MVRKSARVALFCLSGALGFAVFPGSLCAQATGEPVTEEVSGEIQPAGDVLEEKTEATSTPPAEDYEAPDVTVTGRQPVVEQGERSIFTAPLPRDLMERPLTESPGLDTATSVVGKEEIRWLDAFSVIDALKYVPGSWTETRGRKVKQFFSVRGQLYPYPGYLIDGAWFREFEETTYFLSAANLERIEVLRSSGSLLLSPGGLTGLVNLVPRTYTEGESRVDAVYGTHNTARMQVSHGDALKLVSYALGAGYYHTDGGAEHENAEENIGNLYGRAVTKPIPELTLSLSAFSFVGSRELELAEPPATTVLQTREESFDPMRAYYVIGKALFEPDERSATELTVSGAERRFYGENSTGAEWLEHDYEYGTRITQSLKLTDENILRFGGMFNQWVSPTGMRYYVGRRGDLLTWSANAVDEQVFGDLIVNVGYRISQTYIEDFGGFNIEGSSAGLTSVKVEDEWDDPLHTVNLGASYALPEGFSLHGNFSWGKLEAQPGLLDEDLDRPGEETRTMFDLGVKRQWEGLGETSLTGFYVHQEEAPVLSGSTVIVDGDDFALFESADRDNYGAEVEARTRRFDFGLQLFSNFVAMQTRRERDGDDERDEQVPEFIVGGGASYLISCFEIAALVKYVSGYENERFTNQGPQPLGDFTDISLKVAYFFGKKKEHSVYFWVENLLDDDYSTVVGYPDEGIRFKGGLSVAF